MKINKTSEAKFCCAELEVSLREHSGEVSRIRKNKKILYRKIKVPPSSVTLDAKG